MDAKTKSRCSFQRASAGIIRSRWSMRRVVLQGHASLNAPTRSYNQFQTAFCSLSRGPRCHIWPPEPFQNKPLFSSQFSQCQHPTPLPQASWSFSAITYQTRVLYLHGLLRDMFSDVEQPKLCEHGYCELYSFKPACAMSFNRNNETRYARFAV
jgi:hypothetical protein